MSFHYSYPSLPSYEQQQAFALPGYALPGYTLLGSGSDQHSLLSEPPADQKSRSSRRSPRNSHRISHATEVKGVFRRHWQTILWTVLASISFAFTAWFARATFSMDRVTTLQKILHLSLANTLGTLRALQEVTSVLTGFMINRTFEVIEWSLVSGSGGMRVLSFLTLSPTTSLLGVAGVAFGQRGGRISDRLWAVFRFGDLANTLNRFSQVSNRLTMVGTAWAAGFVLFCRHS